MPKIHSKGGYVSQVMRWITRRSLFCKPILSTHQRIGYSLISFLMGVTYLQVLINLKFQLSPAMLLFSLLGAMCFVVCIINLVFLWQEKS